MTKEIRFIQTVVTLAMREAACFGMYLETAVAFASSVYIAEKVAMAILAR